MPWADFGTADIVLTGSGKHKAWQLIILHRDGTSSTEFKLPLATTELHEARYGEFVDALMAMKASGGAGARAYQPTASGFDADAALARYLEKKAGGLLEAPEPQMPARPVFGRKAV